MSLNIKNQQTYALAKELAELTGQSMTAAVTDAIKEKLSRLRDGRKRGSLISELNEILVFLVQGYILITS